MAQTLKQFKTQQTRASKKRINSGDYPNDLTIVAEGDSWFDYPFKKDIIDYLIKKGYAIENHSKAGDTLENMVYGSKYKKQNGGISHQGPQSFQKTLNSIKNLKPRFVLFSGGGNDIVGSEILGYLNHKLSKPDELLNKNIFEARLLEMKIAIEYFINSVNKTYRGCDILMDGYDYPKVNGKGYSFIFNNVRGPWLLPSMGKKAITKKKDQKEIIEYLVDRFNETLIDLDNKYPLFHHVDLRGRFPAESAWDNEIHLKNSGFKEIAGIYHDKIVDILNQDPIMAFHDNE